MALNAITKLIDAGEEKGYLTYHDAHDLIPHDVHSPEDLDDLLTTIGTQGIDVLEGQPKLAAQLSNKSLRKNWKPAKMSGSTSLQALAKTNDPVRIYLREMGMVPLLTREGEVELAKRIERGQLRTLKALSRSPIVVRQVLTIGEDLKLGIRSITEIVVFEEEEITDEILQDRAKTSRAGSTSCKSITKEPASWPDGYRPSQQERKHANTAAADGAWAARLFGFRSPSATLVSRISNVTA